MEIAAPRRDLRVQIRDAVGNRHDTFLDSVRPFARSPRDPGGKGPLPQVFAHVNINSRWALPCGRHRH
jgi:hypothetical protein